MIGITIVQTRKLSVMVWLKSETEKQIWNKQWVNGWASWRLFTVIYDLLCGGMFTLWRWSQIKIYIKCPRDIESVENNPSTVYSSELRVVVQLMGLCNRKKCDTVYGDSYSDNYAVLQIFTWSIRADYIVTSLIVMTVSLIQLKLNVNNVNKVHQHVTVYSVVWDHIISTWSHRSLV